jgi:hypothetical protein
MPGKAITDHQVRRYMQSRKDGYTQAASAARAGFSESTARRLDKRLETQIVPPAGRFEGAAHGGSIPACLIARPLPVIRFDDGLTLAIAGLAICPPVADLSSSNSERAKASEKHRLHRDQLVCTFNLRDQ